MTKEEVLSMYKEQCFIIAEHKPLVAIGCIAYKEDETEEDFIFTVPIEWLVNYMNKLSSKVEWDWSRVQDWLQNEYTYEDSKPIFEQAIIENVCVNVNF